MPRDHQENISCYIEEMLKTLSAPLPASPPGDMDLYDDDVMMNGMARVVVSCR